jgi:hypothetical protein
MAYFTDLHLSSTFFANIFVHNFTSSLDLSLSDHKILGRKEQTYSTVTLLARLRG